jgi:hypothetical protein
MSMRLSIEALWEFARYRDMAFRDLLGILDAPTKYVELSNFNENQRNVLRNTFADLARWHIAIEDVDAAIERFAESTSIS